MAARGRPDRGRPAVRRRTHRHRPRRAGLAQRRRGRPVLDRPRHARRRSPPASSLSAAIDPHAHAVRDPVRGRRRSRPHADGRRPGYISGKLMLYKDSPVQLPGSASGSRARGTDALCVESPARTRAATARASPAAARPATAAAARTGDLSDAPIIGFSNADLHRRARTEMAELDGNSATPAPRTRADHQASTRLRRHETPTSTCWPPSGPTSTSQRSRTTSPTGKRDESTASCGHRHPRRPGREDSRDLQNRAVGAHSRVDPRQRPEGRCWTRARRSCASSRTRSTTRARPHRRRRRRPLIDDQAEYLDMVFAEVADLDEPRRLPDRIERLRTRWPTQTSRAARDRASQARPTRWSASSRVSSRDGLRPEPRHRHRVLPRVPRHLDQIIATGLARTLREEWRRRLSEWSGQDLVPLHGAFDIAIEDIEDAPRSQSTTSSPTCRSGQRTDRLRICLRRLNSDDVVAVPPRAEGSSSSGITDDAHRRAGRGPVPHAAADSSPSSGKPDDRRRSRAVSRDLYLDVRRHVGDHRRPCRRARPRARHVRLPRRQVRRRNPGTDRVHRRRRAALPTRRRGPRPAPVRADVPRRGLRQVRLRVRRPRRRRMEGARIPADRRRPAGQGHRARTRHGPAAVITKSAKGTPTSTRSAPWQRDRGPMKTTEQITRRHRAGVFEQHLERPPRPPTATGVAAHFPARRHADQDRPGARIRASYQQLSLGLAAPGPPAPARARRHVTAGASARASRSPPTSPFPTSTPPQHSARAGLDRPTRPRPTPPRRATWPSVRRRPGPRCPRRRHLQRRRLQPALLDRAAWFRRRGRHRTRAHAPPGAGRRAAGRSGSTAATASSPPSPACPTSACCHRTRRASTSPTSTRDHRPPAAAGTTAPPSATP